MKSLIFCILLGFAIFDLGLAQNTTAKPNTDAALKLKDVFARLNSDPALSKLLNQTVTIYNEIQMIEKVFEIDIALRNITQLNEILHQVREVRKQTAFVLAEIRAEIAGAPIRSFLNRILQETLRIEVGRYDQLLKWIGLEILGDLSDVSKFEDYAYSEVVAIARELLMSRFMSIMLDAYEADKLIAEAQAADPLHLKIELAARTKIDSYFKDMIVNTELAKKELAKDYYDEVEKFRLEGKALNLVQKADFELAIDLLNYSAGFVKKYEELFLRINA